VTYRIKGPFSNRAWSNSVLVKRGFAVCALVFAMSIAGMAAVERGIIIREGTIYVAPDPSSAKLSNIGRGREVAIVERSPGWANVVGTVENDPEQETERNVTGWIVDKGVITPATPDGDKIIFGEAVDSEAEASRRGGRKGAAQDAMRLYARLAEYFPTSALAAEALYRSADIRWQIEAIDASTRPSSRERDPSMKYQIDDQYMKKVIKKFPGTKWADLAAYRLLDNKTCGDWAAEAKCPELEATLYMKYADEHPQSPKAPEALYKAAYRYSALIVIYKSNNDGKKAADSVARATSVAKRIMSQFPDNSDWSTRAERLLYMVQNNMPTFGPTVE
jgi:outer membrane protein assembly factor BamD (BamD/ComL family)